MVAGVAPPARQVREEELLSSMPHMHLSLGLLAMTITACAGQPAASPPAEAPELVSPPVYFESDLVGLVPEADKPLVLEIEPEGQAPVTVRYARGVEETVRWDGSGQGVAELRNEHGQLVWRVSEGGEGFSGTIPAGLYTLALQGGPATGTRRLVLEPTIEDAGQRRDLYWQDDQTDRGLGSVYFANVDLADMDFSGRNLSGTTFRNTRLKRVSFAGADLTMARFDRVHFEDCNFDGARLVKARFRNSFLTSCSFDGGQLWGLWLEDTQMSKPSFRSAELRGAEFYRSFLSRATLSGADLTGIRTVRTAAYGESVGQCKFYPGCGLESVSDHFKAALTTDYR